MQRTYHLVSIRWQVAQEKVLLHPLPSPSILGAFSAQRGYSSVRNYRQREGHICSSSYLHYLIHVAWSPTQLGGTLNTPGTSWSQFQSTAGGCRKTGFLPSQQDFCSSCCWRPKQAPCSSLQVPPRALDAEASSQGPAHASDF